MDPLAHLRFQNANARGLCPPGVLSQAIKNQVIWRKHRNTLPLAKRILFPKKENCQGLIRPRGRSVVVAAVIGCRRQAGRFDAGPGSPLGHPLMAVERPSSPWEGYNY